MKIGKIFISLALFTMCAFPVLTSCGDDDEAPSPSLTAPKFEGISGKYIVDTPASPYESIELGESGSYIVTLNQQQSYAAGQVKTRNESLSPQGMFQNPWRKSSRATNYNGVIYGSYTQLADGTLDLEGFGIIEIVYGNGGEVKGFNLTPENGSPVSLDVTKEQSIPASEKTTALCRTWRVESIRDIEKENGNVISDDTYSPENPGDYYEDEMPTEVLFSKAGTYMVYYKGGTLGIASWKWKDEQAGTIYYAWDNRWEEDDFATCMFSGNRLTVYECWTENEGGVTYTSESYTNLVEK